MVEPGTETRLNPARRALLARVLAEEGLELPAAPVRAGRSSRRPAPLSFAQERLWFLDQLHPGNPVYHIARALRLRGELDPAVLEWAINEIVRRHDVLRTTFPYVEDRPVQRIAARHTVQPALLDLRGIARSRRHTEARRVLNELSRAPFDLQRGPLIRTHLLQLGAREHELLLTLHQIVCDGWSINILLRELAVLYGAAIAGAPAPLPAPRMQYRAYARRERHSLRTAKLQRQLAYWRGQLHDSATGIALPTDHARPALQSFRGGRVPLTIPKALFGRLKTLGRSEKATPFVVLMAAFKALLWRYSRQDDISVGFPAADRDTECGGAIGLFVNTLVLRSDLSGNPTFRQLLDRLREQCRGALAHRDLPFDRLVEELQRERDLSRSPLFQVLFAYQNYAPAVFAAPGLRATALELAGAGAKFDLTLSLREQGARAIGFIEYAADLFERSTIDRMMRHLVTLLSAVAAQPDRPLAQLPLLAKRERHQVLVEWNRTDAGRPTQRCLQQLFESQAMRAPSAVAVECGSDRLTYGELNRRANRLARFLRKRGMGPEQLAAICLDRSLEMVVALLAVLKSGGAYLPLDPKYPAERIAFMLRDSKAKVLLTRKKFLGGNQMELVRRQLEERREVVYIDSERGRVERESSRNFSSGARAGNLAYVIYTSGSTGEPKGVAIEHRSATALLHWAKSVFSSAELAGVVASTSICFDLSIFELFAPWSRGGKVILLESPLDLAHCAERRDITLINTVPSAMSELLAAGGLPPSVRTVNLAGEPLTAELVRQIYALGTVDKVYDLYGPSETTTYSTFGLREADSPPTIGRPIGNTRVYLLDASLEPVPIGVPGEIFIGGAGVARGYLRRPQLTAEKFLRDPFQRRRDARMYRTGDLARWRTDGTIEYLGRADDQVKIRGYRIELGEIEAVLASHPAVRECVVARRSVDLYSERDDAGSKIATPEPEGQLIAYVVGAPVGELRNFLRGKLPEFMVPAKFVALEALPHTPSGKVDRFALTALDDGPPARPSRDFVAPRDELEEMIAQVWRAVLKIERIGVFDDFFDLGGHSLRATRVAARLRAACNVELPLRKLFEARTIADLAREIAARRSGRRGIPRGGIPRAAATDQAPLSFAQRRLWFLHKVDLDLAAYNMPAAYRISGPLNLGALDRALEKIVRRHESLRTAIVEIRGEPAQQVVAGARLLVAKIDLTDRTEASAESEIARLVNEDAVRPFDLGAAPLVRAKILHLADEDHVLLLNFHHIICDGSSLAVFYRELATLYEAELSEQERVFPELAIRYLDFAVWQQSTFLEERLEPQLAYWRRQLSGKFLPIDLPVDQESPAAPSYRGGRVRRRLSRQLCDSLKRLARQEAMTPFMIFLAALKLLLSRLAGQTDIIVGTTMAGRNQAELEGVIGFFVNALALRSDLSGNPRFVELLGRVRETCLDAYTHQDAPFELVVEALKLERVPHRNPLFQVLFNMDESEERELRLSGCKIRKLERDVFAAKFDLVAGAADSAGAVELSLAYNADLFSASRAHIMLEQWCVLLDQIAADPRQRLDSFSLAVDSAGVALPDPTARLDDRWRGSINQAFSRKAKENPRKPAVVDERETWSYGELERASTQLAGRMRSDGLQPKDAVAIYAHRDASLALAVLGVLKAGAVFFILDPAYPPARLLQYLRLARPAGFIRMESAGAPPAEIGAYLDATSVRLRLTLPRARRCVARELAGMPAHARAVKIVADDPAYIAFTSGSTGAPKAVLGRHGPVTHFLQWQTKAFDLKGADRYAFLSGLGYNHLQRELFTAFALGATVCAPAAEELHDAARLARWLQRNDISVLHLTPALGRVLQTAPEIVLPRLRRVFFGGDRLLRRDVFELCKRAPKAKFASFYGATETQRAVGCLIIDNPRNIEKRFALEVLPIGNAGPDVQLLLLTPAGRLTGVGEVGELYVRSPHLAAGYIGDSALSENNFIINPFTRDPHDRLYRTREFGRYLLDGKVEWLGRNQRRVHVRGYRIELAEIEGALAQCPGVRAAAALAEAADEHPGGDAITIAYVESVTRGVPDAAMLREQLNARLPGYMIPSVIHFIERMPLTPNGKIDYSALPKAERIAPPRSSAFEAPINERERAVERVFAEVLQLERVGTADNFFALGGHSLLAAKAAARLRETLGVELDLRAFLEAPTVAEICRRLEGNGSATRSQSPCAEREELEL